MQIEAKKLMGICKKSLSEYQNDPTYSEYCSDGGLNSVLVQHRDVSDATSGCDYGSSPKACAQARPFKKWIAHCSPTLQWGETPTTQNDRCSCVDECGVGEPDDPIKAYHPADKQENGTAYCRDGGTHSQSSTCNYGTQCALCIQTPTTPSHLTHRTSRAGVLAAAFGRSYSYRQSSVVESSTFLRVRSETTRAAAFRTITTLAWHPALLHPLHQLVKELGSSTNRFRLQAPNLRLPRHTILRRRRILHPTRLPTLQATMRQAVVTVLTPLLRTLASGRRWN